MIEITKYVARPKGALQGYINITVHEWAGFQINDMAYFESNGKKWINLPSREYLNKEGEKKYAPYNGFATVEAKYAFQDRVIQALTLHLAKSSSGEGQHMQVQYQQSPASNNNMGKQNRSEGTTYARQSDWQDQGCPF